LAPADEVRAMVLTEATVAYLSLRNKAQEAFGHS
jgi:hypothetical protein